MKVTSVCIHPEKNASVIIPVTIWYIVHCAVYIVNEGKKTHFLLNFTESKIKLAQIYIIPKCACVCVFVHVLFENG